MVQHMYLWGATQYALQLIKLSSTHGDVAIRYCNVVWHIQFKGITRQRYWSTLTKPFSHWLQPGSAHLVPLTTPLPPARQHVHLGLFCHQNRALRVSEWAYACSCAHLSVCERKNMHILHSAETSRSWVMHIIEVYLMTCDCIILWLFGRNSGNVALCLHAHWLHIWLLAWWW